VSEPEHTTVERSLSAARWAPSADTTACRRPRHNACAEYYGRIPCISLGTRYRGADGYVPRLERDTGSDTWV